MVGSAAHKPFEATRAVERLRNDACAQFRGAETRGLGVDVPPSVLCTWPGFQPVT